jgi:hypothetical protein
MDLSMRLLLSVLRCISLMSSAQKVTHPLVRHIYSLHVQHDFNPQHLYDIFRQGLCMRVSTVLLAMLCVGTFDSPGVRLTVCVT